MKLLDSAIQWGLDFFILSAVASNQLNQGEFDNKELGSCFHTYDNRYVLKMAYPTLNLKYINFRIKYCFLKSFEVILNQNRNK